MTVPTPNSPAFDPVASATDEMLKEGFDLSPVPGMEQQLAGILHASPQSVPGAVDLRELPWSSVDNDTSRDLDQIEWAEELPDAGESAERAIRVRIGIADVAATVAQGTQIDIFAQRQTQTVYTVSRNFPMLPVELSTGLTSLNPDEDRNALVAEFTVMPDGSTTGARMFAATVRNSAQLSYRQIGRVLAAQLCNDGGKAEGLSPELAAQVCLQAKAAQRIRAHRQAAGALDFRRAEATPVVADGVVMALETTLHNPAMDMIEDLMIAANETAATTLRLAKRSCLRRVVRSPERWNRIADLLKPLGYALPPTPDSGALNRALAARREQDPDHYPDLALAVIKLMGAGEYVLVKGDDPDPPSHFALAAHDYAHSTAPNRRFADLVTQRILHATLQNTTPPYTDEELAAIATHCNERDKAARKVERAMTKRAQALAMSHNIGQTYKAVVTGAGPKGTFVRVLSPPVEGMLVHGGAGLDVGDCLTVKLVHTDAAKAFIDFVRA